MIINDLTHLKIGNMYKLKKGVNKFYLFSNKDGKPKIYSEDEIKLGNLIYIGFTEPFYTQHCFLGNNEKIWLHPLKEFLPLIEEIECL